MYVVVMGGGRVGLSLASFLIADGHDVTLIENDETLCSNAAAELDALVICGNGTNTKTLEEANVSSANVFVAATGNDEANLLACILVKEYNIPKIIARVSEPNHAEAFRKVGIDSVISPEITAASYLEKLIIRPKIADLVVMGKGDAELLDFNLENEKVVGKKIGDISPTEDFIIVAVYENGDITIPKPDIVLKKGMKVSILVKTNAAREVMKKFTTL
ncbi:potassium channel family protein [Methanobacterium ferruginis]|uniref:potassium channel family protein n=1 Tax=Methanobacterium ferruginis TaxID=710191 RepID=UPI002573CA05|nr:TrkA family potassium uptake protein [Methanobacterium ferruginis]MCC7551330.1 TrkA family potassium uptake protein [Methanobacterium sp.]BDZ67651.1 potassium transporter TrkA [Methanobacterium ferruginis]